MVLTTNFMASNIIVVFMEPWTNCVVRSAMDWIEWVDDPWNATEVIIINLSATILLRPKIVCEREKIKNIVQYTRIYTPSSCHVESIGKENVAVFFLLYYMLFASMLFAFDVRFDFRSWRRRWISAPIRLLN